MRSILVLAFICGFAGNRSALAVETWAVIGDDVTVGTGTHPELYFDALNLWSLASTDHSRLNVTKEIARQTGDYFPMDLAAKSPQRLMPSRYEYRGLVNWFSSQLLYTISRVYLDVEELAWPHLLGVQSGIPSERLWLAGQSMARVRQGASQVDRILDRSHGRIPEKLFVFFSGYDVCGPLYEYMTSTDAYEASVEQMLAYLRKNGDVSAQGTDVYLMAPLNLTMLRQRESILKKKVPAFGKTMTCDELHQLWQEPWTETTSSSDRMEAMAVLDSVRFPKGPAPLCSTLFGRNFDQQDEDQLAGIANRLRGYQSALKKISDRWQAKEDAGFRVHYVDQTAKLVLEGDDIANDCFHLSPIGQAKVARMIQKDLLALPAAP